MTVLAGTQAYIQYTGTGSRVFYEYGFVMLEDSIVYVLVDGQPTEVTLQETGVVFDPAPALDAVILIYRITDITQLADFQSFEAFHGVKTEDALDKLILLKQEAAIFRAQMNLLANHKLDRVTIENDKGTDANIFLWNELEAGVFGGEVTENMPNAGAVVEKPEDFAYFQWGGAVALTQTLTTTLYPIETADAMEMSIVFSSGIMAPIGEDQADISSGFVDAEMRPILLSSGPFDDFADMASSFVDADMHLILISSGPFDDAADISGSFVDAFMEPLLIKVYAPDDAMEMSIDLDFAACSMTPV